MGTSVETEVSLVEAKMNDCKTFALFLKHLHFHEDLCFIFTQHGIKLTTEDSKIFQANAFLQKELFREYLWHSSLDDGQEIAFDLDLPSLLDAISLFGGTTASLYLRYLEGRPLQVWLEDQGVVVEVHVKVRRPWEPVDFNFVKAAISAKILFAAEHMKEILGDLDGLSEYVVIKIHKEQALFQLKTKSAIGECTIEIPESSELISHFSANENVEMTYKALLLKQAFKPVGAAEKLSFRVSPDGLLCIQYMIRMGEVKSFLEFICCPSETPD